MKKEKINIFDALYNEYLMENGKFSIGFNMPEALSGENTFGLPPYTKIKPYLVDKYPACPSDWMRSEGIIKSFFVPVIEGKGMWLDLNNNQNHTHHVAIVVSVQGVNPITGLPCKDAQMEQYIEECPKHKIKFGPDRYCSKCDYKWPKQNYICTTGTPHGKFWLDGFRTVEGVVRQYILTAEKMRGVASNIIGKDRVYAIGLSFFISKEKKPELLHYSPLRGGDTYSIEYFAPPQNSGGLMPTTMSWGKDYSMDSTSSTNAAVYCGSAGAAYSEESICKCRCKCSELVVPHDALKSRSCLGTKGAARSITVQTKKLEVGAGAKINQSIYDDPEKLDFWHDKPESIICINYAAEIDCRKIIEAGEINTEGQAEGFLKEIPVGN
jgi:hypothetical protein